MTDAVAHPTTPADGAPARPERRPSPAHAGWLLSAPALILLAMGATGPLIVVVIYAFLEPGEYSGVVWRFSTDAWFQVLLERDIFDDTITLADAQLTIFRRSVRLSLPTTSLTFAISTALLTLTVLILTVFFLLTRRRGGDG